MVCGEAIHGCASWKRPFDRYQRSDNRTPIRLDFGIQNIVYRVADSSIRYLSSPTGMIVANSSGLATGSLVESYLEWNDLESDKESPSLARTLQSHKMVIMESKDHPLDYQAARQHPLRITQVDNVVHTEDWLIT